MLVGNLDLPFRLVGLAILVPMGMPEVPAAALTIVAVFLVRYVITHVFVYRTLVARVDTREALPVPQFS